MKVLFFSPGYPPEMNDFTRGLAEVGAEVVGIGDSPPEGLSDKARNALVDYLRVPLHDAEAIVAAVRRSGHQFDRVECLWEPFVEHAALVREALGIPGMSVDVARSFRDKEIMKQRVEAAGIRVPHHTRVRSRDEARVAAERFGYPVILKPIDGAGSADTFRVNDARELEVALARTAHVTELSVEEFVDGEEFTFDTVCIGGRPAWTNVAQYHPRPLIARSNEWISPIVTVLRDIDQPRLRGGVEMGMAVLAAMGMQDGFTHMEWYRKSNGEVVFGEIGGRSAGGHLVDQMNFCADIDLFREWARAVCWHDFQGDITRRYNVSIIFKRAQGEGRITHITGLEHYMARYGRYVVADTLLRPGTPRRNWLQTLVSDGFLLVRHPDHDACMAMAEAAATDVQLYAG